MADAQDEFDLFHPRFGAQLIGHEVAENRLLDAYFSGKMHHAWILGGITGIGKATLAYRLASFILSNPDPAAFDIRPTSLDVASDNLVKRRIAAQGHADLLVVAPAWDPRNKRYKTEIGVNEARRVADFFSRTAGEGGWRICIVDPADSMNVTAANSLLKILEEPPSRALFLLIADTPGRLLQTIRSRCLRLDLQPLADREVEDVLDGLAARESDLGLSSAKSVIPLAGGSPGCALRILKKSGFENFQTFLNIVENLPNLDHVAAVRLAQQLAARNAGAEFLHFCDLLLSWLTSHIGKAVREGSRYQERPPVLHPAAWAAAYDEVNRSLRLANALNLDKQNTVLNILNILSKAAGDQPPAQALRRHNEAQE